MNKHWLAFFKGFIMALPLVTFIAGYRLGSKKELIVYKDVPVVKLKLDKKIGQVAGTRSAELLVSDIDINSKELDYLSNEIEDHSDPENVDLWQVVNTYRSEHGFSVFSSDSVLCEFAKTRLDQLITNGQLDDHNGFKTQAHDFLQNKGYKELAENMAQGFDSAEEIIASWDSSTGHRSLLQSVLLTHACASYDQGFAILIAGTK